ncbi:MAG: TetR/AcrR family transcriptional regulator [Proteobacteria bacterium]|nr:TetR/AcrR family transcriptional regulator [Pseudomonadota bacterium]
MGRVSDARVKLMKAVTELIWTGSYGSTTIDHICERAGVKKGSFYYFFESKAALAEVAIQSAWDEYRPKFDQVFSPSLPPLERIHCFCEFEYQEQLEMKRQFGHVLGCPLCTLGTEVSTQEAALRQKVQDIMDQSRLYFETTIRDAHAAGIIRAPDAAAKARTIYAFNEGLMTQARIRNDVEVLREMERGILDLLGVKSEEAVAA